MTNIVKLQACYRKIAMRHDHAHQIFHILYDFSDHALNPSAKYNHARNILKTLYILHDAHDHNHEILKEITIMLIKG